MSTERDTTRIVRSWLKSDDHESADRVLDAVLDQIDTTRQRRATWWPARRFADMSHAMRIALASAAVVTVALIGITLLRGQGVGAPDLGGPSPLAPSSATETRLPAIGVVSPGSYVIDDPFPVHLSMELGEGWAVWSGIAADAAAVYQESVDPPAGRGIIVAIVENLRADACDPLSGPLDPPLGPTVDDLASGLADQPATEASEPTDVTIDGYSGKYLEYTMTGGGEGCPTRVTRWFTSAGPREGILNEHDQVWILDVEGARLVIDAFSFEETSQAELAELRRVVESMQIQPASGGSQP
jgi:hypothetical protein